MFKNLLLRASLVICVVGMAACSLLSPETSVARTHPDGVSGSRPMCTECHENEPMKGTLKLYGSFNHTPAFVKDHKFAANQDNGTCATCHSQSSCADCHQGKGVMSPALKLADRPDRMSPHRGGYLALHRVEGKMDPTGCFKCHGRANNQLCTTCHK
ncbi:MAG TPA: hypothetical protein VJ505_07100 [Holophagaceae bacterium]|nr:hypothetical protein [Holophagaceae bacterium]